MFYIDNMYEYIPQTTTYKKLEELYWIYHQHNSNTSGECIATRYRGAFVADSCGEKIPLFIIKVLENLVKRDISDYYNDYREEIKHIPMKFIK